MKRIVGKNDIRKKNRIWTDCSVSSSIQSKGWGGQEKFADQLGSSFF